MEPEFNDSSQHIQRGKSWLIIAVMIVIAALASVLILTTDSETNNGDDLTSQASQEVGDIPTITVTERGFEPEVLLVNTGTEVRWVNETNEPILVASDPFPESTNNPELNAPDPIGPGESFVVQIGSDASYGYHNAYDPVTSGTIITSDE